MESIMSYGLTIVTLAQHLKLRQKPGHPSLTHRQKVCDRWRIKVDAIEALNLECQRFIHVQEDADRAGSRKDEGSLG